MVKIHITKETKFQSNLQSGAQHFRGTAAYNPKRHFTRLLMVRTREGEVYHQDMYSTLFNIDDVSDETLEQYINLLMNGN